jgi:hypothetical protein
MVSLIILFLFVLGNKRGERHNGKLALIGLAIFAVPAKVDEIVKWRHMHRHFCYAGESG